MDDTDWIGDIYTSTFGWNVLEDIAEGGPRLGASEGERRAHDRVKLAFEEAGLREIRDHTYQMPKWERGSAGIDIESPRELELDCIALPGTPEASLTGEFVHLGYGLPEDFESHDVEGKIVIARSDVPKWHDHWMHRREKYGLCKRHGAAGFVYANHIEGCLPPTGSLGGGLEVIGPIPAVGVSSEVGARLRRLCSDGTVHGRLDIDVRIGEGTSQNVTGVVGPDTGSEIIVGAHVDGHDISQAAIDNGAGVAIMCDVARSLGRRADELDMRVRFIGFGAEELGLVGAQHYALDHDLSEVKIVVNLDGIGLGHNLLIHDNNFDGISQPVDRLAEELCHPVTCVPEYVVHSDHWPFVWKGVPGVMVTADNNASGRGFAHTSADTLEKVDIRALRNHAIVATRFVELVSDTAVEIPHRDAHAVRDDLKERDYEEPLRLAGDWPYE